MMNSSHIDLTKIEELADRLSKGLQTLLAEVETRRNAESVLRKAFDEARHSLDNASTKSLSPSVIADLYRIAVANDSSHGTETIGRHRAVKDALEACRSLKDIAKPLSLPVAQKCPVVKRFTDPEDLEQDFTTPGIQGSLECPFAKLASNGLPTPNSGIDPIAAEFHQDQASVQGDGAANNANKCPIRFLDQHSPEEVAKYFENHKHEIPRSHEICVKRYQQNEHSIRELDEKYGSLVNMIQGLGVKHKQYLPENERTDNDEERDTQNQASTEAVEKWADNISHAPENIHTDVQDDDERIPYFEKSLREIRVGESPSRPWGISVPIVQEPAASAKASSVGVNPTSYAPTTGGGPTPALPKAVTGCPLGGANKFRDQEEGRQEEATTNPSKSGEASMPHIVFNGPVFFGYPPEQAAAFMKIVNTGK